MTRRRTEAGRARDALADVPAQLAALRSMTVGELRERYSEVFGEPSRSRNRDYLRRKIAWRVQELAEGGLSARARAKIAKLGKDAPVRWRPTRAQRAAVNAALDAPEPRPQRDPRLPAAGETLRREYQGVVHEVTVLDDGFEYGGRRYRSLSRVAREIAGTAWNGYTFFHLASRGRGRRAAQ